METDVHEVTHAGASVFLGRPGIDPGYEIEPYEALALAYALAAAAIKAGAEPPEGHAVPGAEPDPSANHDDLFVQASVGLFTRKPLVHFQWGGRAKMLSVEEAIEHATWTFRAAEAARADTALHNFLIDKLELDPERAAETLQEMRRSAGRA